MGLKRNGYSTISDTNMFIASEYQVFVACPGCITKPLMKPSGGLNIRVTGDIRDTSHKNFEIIVQCIGLRAQPVITLEPKVVRNLKDEGSDLDCEGFVWRFGVEREQYFDDGDSPVGLLVSDLNNMILFDGTQIKTTGDDMNIDFKVYRNVN